MTDPQNMPAPDEDPRHYGTPDWRDSAPMEMSTEEGFTDYGVFCPRCEDYVDPDTHSWCGGLE